MTTTLLRYDPFFLHFVRLLSSRESKYLCLFVVKQVACIQLINTIVITPDDLDFRLHLRNEFMRVGLADILEVNYYLFL